MTNVTSRPIIEVENLSKFYRLGTIGATTLRESFDRWWHRVWDRKKEREKIGPKALMVSEDHPQVGPEPNTIWALKDVSFSVEKGEVIGIIGKNGAGKSTLLKILSRITEPTSGRAVLRGRVSSLLEVGTGFHPELTGRENIYLNGAILGMRKREIHKKFDAIVDFAEIEKFIDTPVKRYSSGMYVRLAFAVAAHLDSEILIVDEVLAVGDAAFQKKCLGKMGDVAKGGRTVLFVSHNMGVINKLCHHGICFGKGEIVRNGKMEDVIQYYLTADVPKQGEMVFDNNNNYEAIIRSISIRLKNSNEPVSDIPFKEPFLIEITVESAKDIESAILGIGVQNSLAETITTIHTQEIGDFEDDKHKPLLRVHKGVNKYIFNFSPNFLRPGNYSLGVSLFSRTLIKTYDYKENTIFFRICQHSRNKRYFDERQAGLVFFESPKWTRVE